MNLSVIKTIAGWALLVFLPALTESAQLPGKGPSVEELISHLSDSLGKGDLETYLGVFGPEVRNQERDRVETFFNEIGMDSVSLQPSGRTTQPDGRIRLFFQAYFQNSFSSIIDNWQYVAALDNGRWEIVEKETFGKPRTFYKVKIPSGRSERVRSVEITHRDIRLSFKNPAVFYDNIPGFETALVIIGKGRVVFNPSDPIEKHQLEILYRKRFLDDDIKYLFVRCSRNFFSSNIAIEKGGEVKPVTESDRNKAASVFTDCYPRSFTIDSPDGDEILSLLPQSNEAVFEFKSRKAGDLTYIYHPFSDEEVNLYDRKRGRVISLYHPTEGSEAGLKSFFISFEEKYDIDSYNVEVAYSPSQTYLTGRAKIRVIPEIDGFSSIKFRFNSNLQILRITDKAGRELFFTQDKLRNLLYVHFMTSPRKGDPVSLEVTYRGKISPPVPSTDIIGQTTAEYNKIILTPRFETFFFTQNAHWYPAPPNEDYFTFRLEIVVPPGYDCVATGQLVEKRRWERMNGLAEIEKAGSDIMIFESQQPVKYMSFIVGRFGRQKESAGSIPIQTFISNEVMSVSQSLVERTRNILEYYSDMFGPYPYKKLGIVLRTWPTTGGHSPPSFIVLNQIYWGGEMTLPMRRDTPVNLFNWEDYFLAHEIAHQWWGQGVSFATYRDQWLSEGLAQFASASYLIHKNGERARADVLKKFSRWTEKKTAKGPINLGARLSYYDYEAYQAIVYNKSALALIMLRDLVGEETFLRGLRKFFETFKFQAARTANFIGIMESVSGRNLRGFFDGWFYSYELPHVRTAVTSEKTEEGYLLKIRLTQLQNQFEFPLWIEWTSGGETKRHMVVVTESLQDFVFPVPGKPERVRINPSGAVPGKFD